MFLKEMAREYEMDEEIKRWTARRKRVLVLGVIRGKTTVSESSRRFDLPSSEIESWTGQAKSGMTNALKAKSEDIREQYESQLKALQEGYREAMLELRAGKNGTPCRARGARHDSSDPAGIARRRVHCSDDETLSSVRCSSVYGVLQARESEAEGSGSIC